MSRQMDEEVITPLEELIAAAPAFLPAVAQHAVAVLRAGFLRSTEAERDWQAVARTSLERANRLAPDLVETQLARAILATHEGRWREAVVALRGVMDAAPAYAPALQMLGSLQCEAGRADEGTARLKLAYALEPALAIALIEVARRSAMRGDQDSYRWCLERLDAQPLLALPTLIVRMRVASWSGDLDEVRRCRNELRDDSSPIAGYAAAYCTVVLGELDVAEAAASLDALLTRKLNSRFASMLCQLATEQMCMRGDTTRAIHYLQRAADSALIDLEWMDRCPVLTPLRPLPAFAEARRKVRARVETIWSA
jgi:lipopolysaccharide biosynthesis regulator YciM